MSEPRRVIQTYYYIPSAEREITLHITNGHALHHLRDCESKYGYIAYVSDADGKLVATIEAEELFENPKAAQRDFQKFLRLNRSHIIDKETA